MVGIVAIVMSITLTSRGNDGDQSTATQTAESTQKPERKEDCPSSDRVVSVVRDKRLIIEQMAHTGWGDNVINLVSGYMAAQLTGRRVVIAFEWPLESYFHVNVPQLSAEEIHRDHADCHKVCLRVGGYKEELYRSFGQKDWSEITTANHFQIR